MKASLNTPAILWVFVWLFALSILGFAAYEIAAFGWHVAPTISALVKPNVKANLNLSILLLLLFFAFVFWLVYDWILS